jgi:acetylglutamate kinase
VSIRVIKLGGSLLDDAARRSAALARIAQQWSAGEDLVLVHGGGKHIDAALTVHGIAKRTYAGLRITDDATLPIVVSTLTGQVSKMLVSELSAAGVRAAGISGCDGATLIAEPHPPIDGVALGHVGRVQKASRGLITALLTQGILPVVAPVAIANDGALLNVNADAAASAIAAALCANDLVYLTDVAGLLDERGDVVPMLEADRIHSLLASTHVTGGMRPKLEAALAALRSGVSRVSIGTPESEGGTALVAA